jgi:phosphohistidine phosphatase
MKTLLILRHAKSSWKDESLPDHERPLNKRGKEEAPRMGRLIRELDLVPDLILCSSAKRAQTTARLVAEEAGYEGEIVMLRELYAAGPEAFIEALANLQGEYGRVMVVGHNPGLEELLEALSGEYQPLPTGALAQVRLPIEHWSELNDEVEGELAGLWSPKGP